MVSTLGDWRSIRSLDIIDEVVLIIHDHLINGDHDLLLLHYDALNLNTRLCTANIVDELACVRDCVLYACVCNALSFKILCHPITNPL